jgi:hypothetical protein
MPKVTIQQFRATLAGRSEQGILIHAYRELARRPEAATSKRLAGWMEWPGAASA